MTIKVCSLCNTTFVFLWLQISLSKSIISMVQITMPENTSILLNKKIQHCPLVLLPDVCTYVETFLILLSSTSILLILAAVVR